MEASFTWGRGIGPAPDVTVTTYYEYKNTATYIYTLDTGGLPNTPKNWILPPKWKTIYNVELILLLNKALHTYMNFKLVLSCFHNQVMQYYTLLHIILIIIITHITHNIITTHSTLLHIILVRY